MRSLPAIVGVPSALALLVAAFGPAEDPPPARSAAAAPDDRIQVLFLGDDGHHRPAERVVDIHAPLYRRGIQIEYTEDLDALEPANLARFDAVLVYANHTEIAPDQDAALTNYVRGGGGLVALHCASYCFLNSADYLRIVGARFKSHGTGVFGVDVVDPAHPITDGLEPLRCWDETYVHEHVAQDLTLLTTRARDAQEPGGAGPEPWTWVREEGDGRVFYTASGHDHRSWRTPGFLDLVTRGIRWAAGEGEPGDWTERPPFATETASDRIPNLPRTPVDPARPRDAMPLPLGPEASLARASARAGLELRLFASEPLLEGKPIHLAFDPRGRAWVLETVDYPNERKDSGGRDRVVILEDTDGDGRADTRKVFADGLSVPTSLAFARGGVVVSMAPDMLFLRDTDGDDVADERSVLFTGFGTGDTHAGPSNLRTGPDGRLWATVGYSGFRGTVGGERHSFAQAIFAFESDGSALEVVASTTNNTWGLGFGEEGSIFASTANGNPSVHAAIPARHYERAPGLVAGALQTIAERMDLHPVTEHVRQVDFHGKYTAAAGHALYTARLFPKSAWNREAYVCSPTGHTIGRFVLHHDGADYVARDGWNLVQSDDEWTAPVYADVGPDGAVWVIDWYNFIVQHNPTPQGFETGAGNAYETSLRDKTHGRIWRVVPRGADVPQGAQDLGAASRAELVAALGGPNLGRRLEAQRILVERRDLEAVPALLAALGEPAVDAAGVDAAAQHALWTLGALGALEADLPGELGLEVEDAVVRALRHPAWGVRRAAVELLPRRAWARDTLLSGAVLSDPEPKVQTAALLALAEMPTSDGAGAAAFEALVRATEADDRWLGDAATIAGAAHGAGFLGALLASPFASAVEGGAEGEAPNLIQNPSFEAGTADRADGWFLRHYSGEASHGLERRIARTGDRCLRIESASGADSSLFTNVRVEPGARYRLGAWILVEGLEAGRSRGASLNVHELQAPAPVRTPGVHGTAPWQYVSTEFEADGRTELTINCLFGGWGWSTGVAYFDDVELVRLAGPLLDGAVGRGLPVVMGAYAAEGPTESIVSTLGRLAGAPDPLAEALLAGLVDGWPADRAPALDDADRAALAQLAGALGGDARAQLVELLGRWSVELGDVVDLDALTAQLVGRARDRAAASASRVAAVERLVALGAEGAACDATLDALGVDAEPSLAAGFVRALLGGEERATATRLLDAWDALGPAARRAAAGRLLRREDWTDALLTRMGEGAVPAAALDGASWAQLEQRTAGTDRAALVARARGAAADPDRAAVVERFEGLLDRPADALRGHDVFLQNCAQCHRLGSEGVALGPELDGVGARSAEELLVAVLDPNRSVEGTYQLWTARTKDGEVLSGRLVSETRTNVELQDTEGQTHLIAREDLDLLRAAGLSIMPAGLEESTGEQGLLDLLAFLRSQH